MPLAVHPPTTASTRLVHVPAELPTASERQRVNRVADEVAGSVVAARAPFGPHVVDVLEIRRGVVRLAALAVVADRVRHALRPGVGRRELQSRAEALGGDDLQSIVILAADRRGAGDLSDIGQQRRIARQVLRRRNRSVRVQHLLEIRHRDHQVRAALADISRRQRHRRRELLLQCQVPLIRHRGPDVGIPDAQGHGMVLIARIADEGSETLIECRSRAASCSCPDPDH